MPRPVRKGPGRPKGWRKHPTHDGKCKEGCGRALEARRTAEGRCSACSRRHQRAEKKKHDAPCA